jgi:hypothetical protein
MKNQVIEVLGPTVLQVGGCRVTLEPFAPAESPAAPPNHAAPPNSPPSPADWRLAEAELQSKSNMPFEVPTLCKTERLELAPRIGGRYHAIAGDEVGIAEVVARHGALWFIVDVNQRPVALKRIDMRWHALPRDHVSPCRGDKIVHNGTESSVVQVLGEAELGGWVVLNEGERPIHILRSEGRVWVSLGAVEVEQ